jgi:hypothetical protein
MTGKKDMEEPFEIKDKRHFAKDGSLRPEDGRVKEENKHEQHESIKKEAGGKTAAGEEQELPEVDFASFIFSLSTSALIQLGIIQDPISKKVEINLSGAKQTINLISMLKEKTKGNLIGEEEKLVDQILFDLRMKYVAAIEKKG